jgi:elongation factor 1-beta
MAMAIVTLKIMPESPDVDMEQVQVEATAKIDKFVGEQGEKRCSIEPIAFGLKALNIIFVMNEKIGSTEPLEADLTTIEGVNSVEVVDVRRAIG